MVGAAAPPTAAAAKGTPKTSTRRKPPESEADGTDAPEEIELTPALLQYGASLGYDADRVRLEMAACLDWFGSREIRRKNWVRTVRNWLTGERKRELQRGATAAPGSYRGGGSGGERQWTGKPGSVTSTDARTFARRTDYDL